MADISNRANYIDSRDIIQRIEELHEECENGVCVNCEQIIVLVDNEQGEKVWEHVDVAGPEDDPQACADPSPGDSIDPAAVEELATLRQLEEQANRSEWDSGVTLIRESYFKEYAMDYASDVAGVVSDRWPFTHVDWDEAADDLAQDFAEVDYDGVTYLFR